MEFGNVGPAVSQSALSACQLLIRFGSTLKTTNDASVIFKYY